MRAIGTAARCSDWLRRSARERGVEYIAGEVVAMTREADRITGVTLGSGEKVSCGTVVNASGPSAARTAAMAGIDVPVEPRKRFSWIFTAETPLDRDLPLTIDPSGVHFRQDGPTTYLAGCPADPDPAVDYDDFIMDHDRWQDHVWPTIAARIPQFQAIRVVNEWAGHYAFNTLDQNAILGPHHEIGNFIVPERIFRPRAATKPGHGPRRVGTDRLWRISQSRPVAIFMGAHRREPPYCRNGSDLIWDVVSRRC